MATLTLARPDIGFHANLTRAAALVDWLDGSWALVFSHPQDFATLDLEADRWRSIIASALVLSQVRAVRLQSPEQRFASWIEQIEGKDALLVLERPKRVSSDELSDRASALRSVLARTSQRFVAILDERMQLRHLFTYEPGQGVPSALDLIAYAKLLRQESRADIRAVPAHAKVIELAASQAGCHARAAHGSASRLRVLRCAPL